MSIRSYTQMKATPQPLLSTTGSRLLQRTCACGAPMLSGEETKYRNKQQSLQRQADPPFLLPEESTEGDPFLVNHALSATGQPLDTATRSFMEPRFGHDFSQVRIHTDERAAESAQGINALAYTVGSDIVFGSGQYAPETNAGQRLLAHELTHVVQQRSGLVAGQAIANGWSISDPSDSFEQEADRIADQVLTARPDPILRPFRAESAAPESTETESAAAEIAEAEITRTNIARMPITIQRCGATPCNCSEEERAAYVGESSRSRHVYQIQRQDGGGGPTGPQENFEDCDAGMQSMIQNATQAAQPRVNNAIAKLDVMLGNPATPADQTQAALQTHFHIGSGGPGEDVFGEVQQIRSGFVNIQGAFSSTIPFECESDCPSSNPHTVVLGYVLTGPFGLFAGLSDIHLCPAWQTCSDQPGTIIHEMSHRNGNTDDEGYEGTPDYAGLSISDAIDNADSYRAFSRDVM